MPGKWERKEKWEKHLNITVEGAGLQLQAVDVSHSTVTACRKPREAWQQVLASKLAQACGRRWGSHHRRRAVGFLPSAWGIAGQEAASGVGHWRSLGRGRGGRAQTGAMVWCTWSALKVGCWAISHTVTQIHIKFLVSRPNTAQYTDMHWIHIHIGIRTTAPCWRVCVSGWTPQSRVPQIRTDARDGLVAWLDKICLHKLLDLS
jgi:hypothetical protein